MNDCLRYIVVWTFIILLFALIIAVGLGFIWLLAWTVNMLVSIA